MEEKIYERQVAKQSLAQRVVDEHQIERHFTAADLRELYIFKPDRLDDPNCKERPTPELPKVKDTTLLCGPRHSRMQSAGTEDEFCIILLS